MSSVLAVIPARYASSRFPGKPLAIVAGVSMIRRVYERAQQAARVDRVVVATDDSRILLHVRDFGGEALMTSEAHSSGTDRVAEAAAILGGADIVINVQGDEPMLAPAMLDELVDALDDDTGCTTPVRPITTLHDLESPGVVKVVLDARNRPLYFSRSPIPFYRDLPMERWLDAATYHAHIGIYAFRASALERFVAAPSSELERREQLEQLRAFELGIPIRCVPTQYHGHAIDTPADVAIVERLLQA